MKIQQVIKAYTVEEAATALMKHGEQAQVLAGGTDLLVQIREGHNKCPVLVDVTDIPELKDIHISSSTITIGGAVRFADVVANGRLKQLVPGLWEACRSVGAPQIRNLGTLAGNIANGSPAADSVPPLLALDAKVRLVHAEGEREVELRDVFVGKGKTILKTGELIHSIRIPHMDDPNRQVAFEKLGLRNALAISRISVAVCLKRDDNGTIVEAGVASGSLGLYPAREPDIEVFLLGKQLTKETIRQAEAAYAKLTAKRLEGRSSRPFKEAAIQGVLEGCLNKLKDERGVQHV